MTSISEAVKAAKRRYDIIGESPQLIAAIDRALRVAPTEFSVLVMGESGVGKEYFPKIIHDNSKHKHNKYIPVNCGAIPEGTIDSELFGHKKGAFTDATSDRKGYFEEADGGTIFLDEVGEMPLSTQARLLRVLENGEIIRMGENTPRKVKIRVVAATNKDMEQAVKEGRFREDLYYRLSTVAINVPALRERGKKDLDLLIRKFMRDHEENSGSEPVTFTDDAKQVLYSYHWPGNVRQLRNITQQIALFEAGNTVDAEKVRQYLPKEGKRQLPATIGDSQFDYTKEREVLFMLIKQLQHEIDEIKVAVGHDGNRAIHVSPSVGELQRGMHHLPRPREEYLSAIDDQPTLVHQHVDAPSGQNRSMAQDVVHVDEVTALEVGHPSDHVKTLGETERETIEEALRRNNGRRKRTAEDLGISERTLYRKIKQYMEEKNEE